MCRTAILLIATSEMLTSGQALFQGKFSTAQDGTRGERGSRSCNGGLGRSLHQGPEAEPLVRGQGAISIEAECCLVFEPPLKLRPYGDIEMNVLLLLLLRMWQIWLLLCILQH